jgi:transcription elongation factor Elf1
MADQNNYPRISLKCDCGNEFNVNVVRMKDNMPVICQICGQEFPVEIAEKMAKAFEDLYNVKYMMDKQGVKFKYAFVYKSTFNQPPAPYTIEDGESE